MVCRTAGCVPKKLTSLLVFCSDAENAISINVEFQEKACHSPKLMRMDAIRQVEAAQAVHLLVCCEIMLALEKLHQYYRLIAGRYVEKTCLGDRHWGVARDDD